MCVKEIDFKNFEFLEENFLNFNEQFLEIVQIWRVTLLVSCVAGEGRSHALAAEDYEAWTQTFQHD